MTQCNLLCDQSALIIMAKDGEQRGSRICESGIWPVCEQKGAAGRDNGRLLQILQM